MSNNNPKVVIPPEDEKYEIHGLPLGLDGVLNHLDLNKDGKSDVVQIVKNGERILPPLMAFGKAGGFDAIEQAIAPHLTAEAAAALKVLQTEFAAIAAAELGK